MKKNLRATFLLCLLALSVFTVQPSSVLAGDINSPGYECTQNCPPPPPPGEDPIDPPGETSSTDTGAPSVDLTETVISVLVGIAGLL